MRLSESYLSRIVVADLAHLFKRGWLSLEIRKSEISTPPKSSERRLVKKSEVDGGTIRCE